MTIPDWAKWISWDRNSGYACVFEFEPAIDSGGDWMPRQGTRWSYAEDHDSIERGGTILPLRDYDTLQIPFPPHKAGLYLTHNEHLDYYETAETWITAREEREQMADWSSPDARQRCIDTNEVWVLHWYPTNPIGFNHVAGPTLEEVLKAAKEMK